MFDKMREFQRVQTTNPKPWESDSFEADYVMVVDICDDWVYYFVHYNRFTPTPMPVSLVSNLYMAKMSQPVALGKHFPPEMWGKGVLVTHPL